MLNDDTFSKIGDENIEFEMDNEYTTDSETESEEESSSGSSLNLSEPQIPPSLKFHYPLKRENQRQTFNQQITTTINNPYDFSNPDILMSIKDEKFPSGSLDIMVNKEETTTQLDSIIHSFTFHSNEVYELESTKSPQTVLPLNTDFFCTDFFDQNYQLKTQEDVKLPSFEHLYDEMKIKNVRIQPNLIPEVLFSKIMTYSDIKVKYTQSLFINMMHYFLTRVIIDICNDESFLFLRSFIPYLSPETQIHRDFPFLISGVLIDVISTLFVDMPIKELKPDEAVLVMSKYPEWYSFIHLLAELIIHRQIPYDSIRKSIGTFRPSILSEQLIIMLASNFLTALPVHETFKICSEIFRDKWLFHAFRTPSIIPTFSLRPDNSQVFPFLYIYGIFSKYFAGEISINAAISSVNSIGEKSLFDSKRILKTFLDAFIELIYQKFINLQNDAGYLELTKFQRDAINFDLMANLPIFKLCIKNKEVMIAFLDRLRILLMRHDYLPKGLPILLYSFVYNNGICSPSAFNAWLEVVCASKGSYICTSGLLIELNTLVNGSIPSDTSFDKLIDLPIQDQINKDLGEIK